MERDDRRGADDEADLIVRPYIITRGRTYSEHSAIGLLAQIVATGRGPSGSQRLGAEQREILERCRRPLSLAEVAAHLDLPVGVVRVLVSDMVRAGVVAVNEQPVSRTVPDLRILQKVIHGLRAI